MIHGSRLTVNGYEKTDIETDCADRHHDSHSH